jgi:SM-20-related protein
MIEALFPQVDNHSLFEKIADDILEKGYSVNPNGLSIELADALLCHINHLPDNYFDQAGIGRKADYVHNEFVRTDEICWINGETEVGKSWLAWADEFQKSLNRRLFLGLFSFESHFAHYAPGDFYKKHKDAFKGDANRVISLVVYLNSGWLPDDNGELVMYLDEGCQKSVKITPAYGTVVAFLSEEFLHEVLPANRHRYSIAGWFRVNTSTALSVDPPN